MSCANIFQMKVQVKVFQVKEEEKGNAICICLSNEIKVKNVLEASADE